MTVSSDLDKKLTLGDPDGPDEFIPTLGIVVPTFVDPRNDLVPSHAQGKFKRLQHHIPFKMRGNFRVSDWPDEYQRTVARTVRTDMEGYVQCHGISAGGLHCKARAVNRSHFCRNHGGALHPADKKISGMTLAPMSEDRIQNLDRVQKFMQGLIDPSELDDDEITGQFIRNNDGIPVKTAKLGAKFQAQLAKELHTRLNKFLTSKAPKMLEIMCDIAENDLYEAGDRIKAAIWVSERVMGKTPDVVISAQTNDAPYASILEGVQSSSREDYRKSVASQRVPSSEVDRIEQEVLDAEVEEDGDFGPDGVDDSEVSGMPGPENVGNGSGVDDSTEDSGYADVVQRRAESIADDRAARLERARRIKKAKQRRFAARAVGATSLSDIPWLIELKPIKGSTEYKLSLIPPDAQTPALVERVLAERSWEPPTNDEITRRRAEAADAEVAKLQAKMDRLAKKGD